MLGFEGVCPNSGQAGGGTKFMPLLAEEVASAWHEGDTCLFVTQLRDAGVRASSSLVSPEIPRPSPQVTGPRRAAGSPQNTGLPPGGPGPSVLSLRRT